MGTWGFAASEFWQITCEEFWKTFDAKRTDKPTGTSLSEDDLAELYEMLHEND